MRSVLATSGQRQMWGGAAHRAAALLALVALPLPGQRPATATAPQWAMTVDAIPVIDSSGQRYPQPWLGGYDVPRPQLVDIDGDGDVDLFVQERSGAVSFFEHTAEGFRWRTDRWQDLDVGEWYRFFDLDGDGDLDLLGELPHSYIQAWRNVGSRTEPRMVAVTDTLRDAANAPIFADRQNILNITDIDCNGRLDLFIGRVTGTIDRYEAEPTLGPDGLLRFRFLTERWEGIEIIGAGAQPVPSTRQAGTLPNGSMHGANTMAFGDIDGDGDQDLLWGDFFEPGLLLIENTDRCPHFSLRSTPVEFPVGNPLLTTGYNAPTIGDIDGDGDADVVMGTIGGAFNPAKSSIENLHLLEQTAPMSFRVATTRLIPMVDVGSESAPSVGDLDGDGDLDMVVGSKVTTLDNTTGTITYFENTGTRTAPVFSDRGDLGIHGTFNYAPTITDLDGDGHADLVVGSWTDHIEWWVNTGSATAPQWTRADSALVVITRGSNTTPALADIDRDGDLDMVVGEASGNLNLYRNIGTRTSPRFELVTDAIPEMDVGRRSAPTFLDADGDGRPDLLIGSEEGSFALWLNRSGVEGIRFERDSSFVLRGDNLSTPTVGDLNGDGRPELVHGTISGGLRLYK